MITRPTCFILGAGASIPYEYPSGERLIEMIVEKIDENHRDNDFTACLSVLKQSDSIIKELRDALVLSGSYSIDALLENRPDLVQIGKYAISYALIECVDKIHQLYPKEDNWYKYLWNKMLCRLDEFDNNQVSIITFNYDISLELFLYLALEHSFRIEQEQTQEKINKIKIIHVHGQLGNYPWENTTNHMIPNVSNPSDFLQRVYNASQSIKIIYEKNQNDEEFITARKFLEAAERVYLLGFAYHEQNLDRLQLDTLDPKLEISGSTFGMTPHEIDTVSFKTNNRITFGSPFMKNLEFIRNFVTLT